MGHDSTPFCIPYDNSKDELVNTKLRDAKICKHVFAGLYHIRTVAWNFLEEHAKNGT